MLLLLVEAGKSEGVVCNKHSHESFRVGLSHSHESFLISRVVWQVWVIFQYGWTEKSWYIRVFDGYEPI